jgi:hypothetical protein
MPFGAEPVGADGKQASAAKTMVVLQALGFTGGAADAIQNTVQVRDGVATGSHVVTAGKRLVLLTMTAIVKNAAAAGQGIICRLRLNPAGAAVVTSPVIASVGAGTYLAIANIVGATTIQLSGGWPTVHEIQGDGTKQIAMSQLGTATAGNDFILTAYEY